MDFAASVEGPGFQACMEALRMKRRDFLKSMTAVAARQRRCRRPAVWSPAKAQSRQETLLIVSESGPNNIDIHGVGTNVPGYEVSWNCYDRLISHEMKTRPERRAVLRPRQVQAGARRGHERRRHVGHLQAEEERDLPRRHAGHRQGREVVARPRRHASAASRPSRWAPARSTKPEQFVVVDDHTVRVDFLRKDRLTMPDLAVIVPCDLSIPSWSRRTPPRRTPGASNTPSRTPPAAAPTRWRAGHAGTEVDPRAQRRLEGRAAAEGEAHHLAHGAVGRQPARAARARRRRHLLRPAEQGFRRAARTPASSTSCRRRTRNGIQYIGMNVKKPPFDNLKVRQAVAYAIPYQKIMDAVLFGLAKPMFGAAADAPTEVAWPQPHKFNTDIAKAKAAAGRGRLSRTASRPRCRSISASPASTSRSAC